MYLKLKEIICKYTISNVENIKTYLYRIVQKINMVKGTENVKMIKTTSMLRGWARLDESVAEFYWGLSIERYIALFLPTQQW